MKSDGFARVQQKQLFVFMRQSFLDLVDLDLDRKNLQDFNDSDFRLIKLVGETFRCHKQHDTFTCTQGVCFCDEKTLSTHRATKRFFETHMLHFLSFR